MANNFFSLCSMLTRDGYIAGKSDDDLSQHVTALPSYTDWHNIAVNAANALHQPHLHPKNVTPVQILHDNISVNTAQILHDFSITYGPRVSPNAARLSAFWGILKYLDAFSLVPKGRDEYLELTGNAQKASHNQRRVMSEELGVAFSIHHGKKWFADLLTRETGSAVDPQAIQVLDIEEVMSKTINLPSSGTLNQKRIETLQFSQKRPDYLLIWSGASMNQASVRAVLLESKGSSGKGTSINQLPGALEQINSVFLGGEHIPGLAVSTASVKDGGEIHSFSLDPGEATKEIIFEKARLSSIKNFSERLGGNFKNLGTLGYSSHEKFASLGESARKGGPIPIDIRATGEFVELGLANIFKNALEISGDVDDADKWGLRQASQIYKTPDALPEPTDLDSTLGKFHGSRITLEVDGGELQIAIGLDENVRTALLDGDGVAGLDAMREINDGVVLDDLPRNNGVKVESKSANGTILSITLKRT